MSLNTRAHWAAALGAGCLLALGACTADNPAYGEGDDEPNPAASTSEGEPSTTRTDGNPDGDTVTSDPDASASATDATTANTSESGSSTEAGEVCELHPTAWIEMTVTRDRDLIELTQIRSPTECQTPTLSTIDGILTLDGTSIGHLPCPKCDCTPSANPPNVIEFDGSLELVDMPHCGRLVAWTAFRPDRDGCVWDGFAVLPPLDSDPPAFFGSNSLDPTPLLPGMLASILEQGSCDNPRECAVEPGAHALTFAGVTVEVDAPEHVVFPDVDDAEYEITTRMASIDPECNELVSYSGVLVDAGG